MPASDLYHPYKIASLKNPEYAAAYIEAILEEEDPEPELLPKALDSVAEALGDESQRLKLNEILTAKDSKVIYDIADWLDRLGLKLTVTVK